jgi:IS5 family transposase
MSIAQEGLSVNIKSHTYTIEVLDTSPLVVLANAIDWQRMFQVIEPDLIQSCEKGQIHRGRKLYVRIHLAIYFLQALRKRTDREIIEELEGNVQYRAFCGASIIEDWKVPHFSKVETFRNRFRPETKDKLNDELLRVCRQKRLISLMTIDIDSTVQEANIAYPSDAKMMLELARKSSALIKKFDLQIPDRIKQIGNLAKGYFFKPKNLAQEKKVKMFGKFFRLVKLAVMPVIRWAEGILTTGIGKVKWNVRRAIEQVGIHGRKYLRDVGYFSKTGQLKVGKILSFHAEKVACISKKKASKPLEFRRAFQLGRTDGNFVLGLPTEDIRAPDKSAIGPMMQKFESVFGERPTSISADKGYYSNANIKAATGVLENGIQAPINARNVAYQGSTEVQEKLYRRRAGIEPLIGHTKKWGLARSKMKSDAATYGSGFTSMIGFNLSQLMNGLQPNRAQGE